jgi:hypothetical protein
MAENKPVSNYLVFAILATVCCCMPFGLPAIYFAGKVNGCVAGGDTAGAEAASKNAKTWCFVALGVGIVAWVLWFVFEATIIAIVHQQMPQLGQH